ncbi:MAG TPA: hypothetical protein VH134_08820 [Candidatus Dormibacteraeota bacterium]|nr:hypothetical protein [Candidatus Dormibacteraeota bacterium]
MSDPTTQDVISLQSSHWIGGQTQLGPEMCFAATEATIQSAFGGTADQFEVAHDVMMWNINAGLTDGETETYQAMLLSLDLDTMNATWAQVQPGFSADMQKILENHRGDLMLTGRTQAAGGALTNEEVMETIDQGGLIAFGNAAHWRIIYGYDFTLDTQALNLWVFDPMDGSGYQLPLDAAGMQMSYRITG